MSTTGRGLGHVVVIGAGIAGLAAAHRLLGRGARVTVLEAG
ncbi:FAD-dependent oxidoreductase, partial [Streptomyces tricolor]